MPEVKITRSKVITVDTVDHNSYGALIFTDKEGTEYKVSDKRAKFFEEIILPDRAVQLNFAVAYEKEYIYNAKPVEGELPPPTKPQVLPEHKEVIEEAVKSTATAVKSTTDPRQESIERQVCIKEIGEDWRAGKLSDDHPFVLGRKLWIIQAMGNEDWAGELVDLASKLDTATRNKLLGTLREKTKGK